MVITNINLKMAMSSTPISSENPTIEAQSRGRRYKKTSIASLLLKPFKAVCGCTSKKEIEIVHRSENMDPQISNLEPRVGNLMFSLSEPTHKMLIEPDNERAKRVVRELIKGIDCNNSPHKAFQGRKSMFVPMQAHWDCFRSKKIVVGKKTVIDKSEGKNLIVDAYEAISHHLHSNKVIGEKMMQRILPLLNQAHAARWVETINAFTEGTTMSSLASGQNTGGLSFHIEWQKDILHINVEQIIALLNIYDVQGPPNGYCTVQSDIYIPRQEIMDILEEEQLEQIPVESVFPSLIVYDHYSPIRKNILF